jgi:hypothetical protein
MDGSITGGEEAGGRGRGQTVLMTGLLIVGILAWLWPIGTGGMMPIGGDVTYFSIGLMAELGRALKSGRLPYWNDLWGFGFPGLAESQMGVYYPPHVLLFGLLRVEVAYTLSLVGHMIWSGLGTAWAARRFGASPQGAAVAGFAWSTCGFFLIHLTHQWGATTASWMPWAWGLAWMASRGEGGRRIPLLLAAVLTLQVLPGHFQLAFITQVTAGIVGLCGLWTRGDSGVRRSRRLTGLALAFSAVVPLGAAQFGPTAELAGLARSQRDVEYLSEFAATPIHMVSYVAPGLFHESPLWRPLAWDAFHAMPEEHRATIGLVPLFLAWIALSRGWRDPANRTLAILALLATMLSLGPYVPGFSLLCQLPGFSFFRAPARWGAAAMLALALLSGRGLDAIATTTGSGRVLRRFVLIAAAWMIGVVGLFEVALSATEPSAGRPAWPVVANGLERAFGLMPWRDEPSLTRRLADSRRPLDDPRVAIALARQGRPAVDPADRTLARSRGRIYVQELGPTAVWLVILFLISSITGKTHRGFVAALLLVLFTEAGYWSRRRAFDLGPIRPLTEQSEVLHRLTEMPRGTRSIDPMRNLSMVAGVAPIVAYRTLDLPIAVGLTRLAELPGGPAEVVSALRIIGVGVRVFQTGEASKLEAWEKLGEVDDPTLLGWLLGADLVRSLGKRVPTTFSLWRPASEPARAWFVSAGVRELERTSDDPPGVLRSFTDAKPLNWRSSRPEEVEIDIEATGPGTVVVTQLDYPRWRATFAGRPVPIVRVFDGWQGVEVQSAGKWTLRLSYDTKPDRICLAGSGVAWLVWCLLYWRAKVHDPVMVEVNGR